MMTKTVYLGFANLDFSKIEMYKFWCDSINDKQGDKV